MEGETELHGRSAGATAKTGDLCVGCGLCCDGTLYRGAEIEPGEEERLRASGIAIEPGTDDRLFTLPCPMSTCGSCKIYETRFTVCRSFRCGLLRRYQAGNIGAAEAARKIAIAKKLLADVVADEPGTALQRNRVQARRKFARELKSADPATRRMIAPQLLRIIALDSFLDRWFRNKDSGPEGSYR